MAPRGLLALALLAVAAPASPQTLPSPCPSLEACLELLGRPMGDVEGRALHERLRSFGPAAAEALVARLVHPDPNVANAAAIELAQFPALDPRHLPTLIRVYERGNVWMPRAIAATGADEALAYLQERARKSPDFSNDNQLHMALARFGDRLRPFVAAELDSCGRGGAGEFCQGIFSTLGNVGDGYPDWAVDSVAALARAPAAAQSVRWLASNFLIRRRHPLGREILRERLEAAARSPSRDQWEAQDALRQLAGYGAAAADLGPLVAVHLGSASADVRAEAALTLGRIGANSQAPGLIALEPRFEDDWLLAYNAVEGLGRMRSAAARPLLERVARGHWHRAVRNNSERALSSLAGGEFARPGVAGDVLPFRGPAPGGSLHFPPGELRYAGDARRPRPCPPPIASASLSQDPPEAVPWPARGAHRLTFRPLAPAVAAELRDRLRTLTKATRVIGANASIPFRAPLRSGSLVAFEQGEWGGALVHLRPESADPLFEGNPAYAFRLAGRLYVVEGLSHLSLSRGSLLGVDERGARVTRRIRLPAEPSGIVATDRRTLLIQTPEGDVALREDGRLIDPESRDSCAKGD